MTDTPTEDDRAEALLDYIDEKHGIRTLAASLLTTPDRWNWPKEEKLSTDRIRELEDAMEDNSDDTTIRRILKLRLTTDDALGSIENEVLDRTLNHIAHQSETGFDRNRLTEDAAHDLPDHLAIRLIQSEIDHIENTMGLGARDYERLIDLYQTLSKHTSPEDTRDTRKSLWDELLMFTEYEVRIRFGNSKTGEQQFRVRTLCRQTNAEAHNDALRNWRTKHEDDDEIELISVDTGPVDLWRPNLDPLDDTDAWVRRDYW